MTVSALAPPLAALKRFTRGSTGSDRCDLCGGGLERDHQHLVARRDARIVCSCRRCAGASDLGGYTAITPSFSRLPGVSLTAADWALLQAPVRLVCVVDRPHEEGVIGLYPSRAGLVRSTIAREAWNRFRAAHPEVGDVVADVESILLCDLPGCSLVARLSIDYCYALAASLGSAQDAGRSVAEFVAALEQGEPCRI